MHTQKGFFNKLEKLLESFLNLADTAEQRNPAADVADNTVGGLSGLQQKLARFANRNSDKVTNGNSSKIVNSEKNGVTESVEKSDDSKTDSNKNKESEMRQEEEKMEEDLESPEKSGKILDKNGKEDMEVKEEEEESPTQQKKQNNKGMVLNIIFPLQLSSCYNSD